MRIQHNITAMNAYRNYNLNTSAVSKNLEKLSSGYKINRAGDDAAGLAISEKMRAQISGLEAAQKNVKDGISLVKTAEGAMQEVQDMLNRMVTLATQSANGTYADDVDREALQAEIDQLNSEIDRIADSTNFNGIKLLDGSLAKQQVATKIDVVGPGLTSVKSEGTKGKYTASAAIADSSSDLDGDSKFQVGDSFEYTVTTSDKKATSVKLTLERDDTAGKNYLVSEDGTKYELEDAGFSGGAMSVSTQDVDNAVLAELKKTDLTKNFNITDAGTADDGIFEFDALTEGTSAPAVTAIDYRYTAMGTLKAGEDIGVDLTVTPLDEGREVDASAITMYDGSNLEDAVFTINGHKFVVLTDNLTGTYNAANDNTDGKGAYLQAGQALGLTSDVTVLISDGTTKNGLKEADANFAQNIALISKVTGLNVGDAVAESSFGATADTGVAPGSGIRLSLGKGTSDGGLTFQIGDTSDSFNQLTVGIDDIHAKALGVDQVNIGTQAGAQAAIDTIKTAINKVSSIRGTLGATQNRLEHTSNNLSVMAENIQDAESTIRDTDVAEEMMSYVKNNILVQSAQAMLAQANQIPQGVLQLLG